MSLLAYNKTTSPLLVAAGNPAPLLPPSLVLGQRGPAVNVTAELKSLLLAQYVSIDGQVVANLLDVEWTNEPEYPTVGLNNTRRPVILREYTTAARPPAASVDVNTVITNLTTGVLNRSNGVAWIDAFGFLV